MSHDPRFALARAVLAAGLVLASLAPSVALTRLPRHHHGRVLRPAAPAGADRDPVDRGSQSDMSGTHNNGYVYNGIGYGRFVPGPDGSFGGYPAGSDGAKELMIQQRRKCQDVPEEC